MGAGASKDADKLVEERIFQLISKCMKSLPFPPGSVTEGVVRKVSAKAERVELLPDQEILKKGQRATGIYILLEGEVHVLSSNLNTLATLLPGDIFGEVSTLFYIPCTALVKTKSKALLILLKTENLRSALNDVVVNVDLVDYYVLMRYLDTNGTLSQPELMHRIAVYALKQVPLFHNWAESAIESLVQKTETDNYECLVIFPAGSMIQQVGQPADEITIITRGSVDLLQGEKCIATFNTKRWPFWIGEEGLYSGKDRQTSIKATTVCQALIIKNSHIKDISERYKSGGGLALKKTLDQWSQLYKRWTPELFQKYQPYLQIEALLKQLGGAPLLQDVPVGFLYALVMKSAVHEYQEGMTVVADKSNHKASLKRSSTRRKSMKRESKQNLSDAAAVLEPGKIYARFVYDHLKDDDRFLLLVDGAIKIKYSEKTPGNLLEAGKLFYIPSNKMLQCSLFVKSTAVLLRFTGTMLFEVCQVYPRAVLNIPSTAK
ncbi:uncharacterized protein LOC117113433 isoform X2 [Anneissia japonica]|uniref:uncharacterized protein LOC117113433 isoform X2 n=1 Tax=Anneissia japonica TaxID=1529436 RepID=UPI001425986E|nr:uncharacterized protein LOC117113433 isoform X2 [Anneissia japonica]